MPRQPGKDVFEAELKKKEMERAGSRKDGDDAPSRFSGFKEEFDKSVAKAEAEREAGGKGKKEEAEKPAKKE